MFGTVLRAHRMRRSVPYAVLRSSTCLGSHRLRPQVLLQWPQAMHLKAPLPRNRHLTEPADAGSKDVEMAGGEKEGTAAAGAVKTEAEAGEKQADEAQAAAAAEGAKGEEAEGVSAKPPGKADIVKRLYDVLRTADFEVRAGLARGSCGCPKGGHT